MIKFLLIFGLLGLCGLVFARYDPTWDSLDSRPLPEWYDKAKIGIFIHWGVFSVPSYRSEWFWWYWQGTKDKGVVDFMKKNYREGFSYADFAPMFTGEFYKPEDWADLFKAAGAKYVVLVSKHHEGFTNWPSKYSWNWNSQDTGPHRDLTGDLAAAIRNRTNLHFGLYHSMFEWFNPLYLQDKQNKFTTQEFVKSKTGPELYEIVDRYRPDVIWSDGDWEAKPDYWNSTEFLAWLYNDSPVKDSVVVNDRWGQGTSCKHGGFLTCSDKYNPGHLLARKWENCMTLDKSSWGYRRNARLHDYLNMTELLKTVIETVSCGGNILINVGPTHDGRIVPVMEERLRELGAWLGVNGEAVYESSPWKHQNDSVTKGVWYTQNQQKKTVYAFFLNWPTTTSAQPPILYLASVPQRNSLSIHLLGFGQPLPWLPAPGGGVDVQLPRLAPSQIPSRYAWTLALTGVEGERAATTDHLERDFPENLVIRMP